MSSTFVNNQRSEIRNEVLNLLTPVLKGFTISVSRIIGIPKEKLPAAIIFSGNETWEADLSRCGYKAKGTIIVRLIILGKLPPEEIVGAPLDDKLDDSARLVESVLTGKRYILNGTLWFNLVNNNYGFSEDDSETIGNLDMIFEYEYILSYLDIIPPPPQ